MSVLADYHVHSCFSFDSETEIEEHVRRAATMGLREICLTDHLEPAFFRPLPPMDLDGYRQAYEQLAPSSVQVKFGIEVGISGDEAVLEELKATIHRMPFDCVIASLHEFHHSDPFQADFFQGWNPTELCREYIRTLLEQLKRLGPDSFSVVGHIDYPAKGYGAEKLPDGQLQYSWVSDELDALFRYLIENGRTFEINTSSCRKLASSSYPGLEWLRRFRELGGEYVSFGSDAHSPEWLGFGFERMRQLAMQAGLQYYTTYDKMRPCIQPL